MKATESSAEGKSLLIPDNGITSEGEGRQAVMKQPSRSIKRESGENRDVGVNVDTMEMRMLYMC